MLGVLVFFKLVVIRRPGVRRSDDVRLLRAISSDQPTIGRGFYEDGIWADTAFIPYRRSAASAGAEEDHQSLLVVISRLRNLARRLDVPGDKYGAARRLLRDKIGEHAIHFTGHRAGSRGMTSGTRRSVLVISRQSSGVSRQLVSRQ